MRRRADACEECGQKGSRGRTEVNLTAVLTYYSKKNQAELGA